MLINKDLTRESVKLYINNHQIYGEVFHKHRGKWCKETYFQSYDWDIDTELVESTVRYIKRIFGLKNPKVFLD